MSEAQDTAALMAEFLEFKAARDAAAAQDTDPDNDRDVVFSSGDSSISLPWRKAREFDLDGMLESRFGLKRPPAPAAQAGGDSDGGSSTGKGKGQGGAQGGAQGGGAASVASLFRTRPPAARTGT